MVLASRWYKLDTRRFWWLCAISILSSGNISAVTLPQNLCSIRRHIHSVYNHLGGRIVDKKKPDRYEIIGSIVAVIGTLVIFYAPR